MITRSRLLLGTTCLMAVSFCFQTGKAHAESLVDVCSGLSVDIPVLQPVATATTGLLGGLLDPILNTIVGDVNVNVVDTLSGKNIGASVRDKNGNLVTVPGDCGVSTKAVEIDSNKGVSIGAGRIDGLGQVGADAAVANDINSIAIGNGAVTEAGAENALAFGLRGTVSATDGVALGRDTNVLAAGGVALGADSLANRAGMNGASEAFSGAVITSVNGAVSVGTTGGERQITNVAGGTADTDAVNVRQLSSVDNRLSARDDSLAAAIGGGASFNQTTNVFTGPTYTLRGTVYTDIGTALTALAEANGTGVQSGVIAANNAAGAAAAAATGANGLAAGYGATASGTYSVAYGGNATASATNATAIGANSVASGANSTALGARASARNQNATAIGAGATTTRDNQVAIGTASSTYTMPGLDSEASRAAQQGPTRVVTSDANGNLATSDIDLNGMARDVASLRKRTDNVQKEARQGIAAAMAMAAAVTPSGPGKTAWATNMAVFRGEVAGSVSLAHTLDTVYPVTVNGAISMAGGSSPGVRVGLAGEF